MNASGGGGGNAVRWPLVLWLLSVLLQGCVYRSWDLFEDVTPEDRPWIYQSKSSSHAQKVSQEVALFTPRVLSLELAEGMLPRPVIFDSPEVRKQRRILGARDEKFIRQALARKSKYGRALEIALENEGVPSELIALAIIESGIRERIKSPSGAVGIWQFMRPTARKYGLRVGLFHDDRKDPVKSTRAAARYLRDLYSQYEDWPLVLAAYNAGETRTNSILKETGVRDFWDLARSGRFPKQTREHVYKFYAALGILSELR